MDARHDYHVNNVIATPTASTLLIYWSATEYVKTSLAVTGQWRRHCHHWQRYWSRRYRWGHITPSTNTYHHGDARLPGHGMLRRLVYSHVGMLLEQYTLGRHAAMITTVHSQLSTNTTTPSYPLFNHVQNEHIINYNN